MSTLAPWPSAGATIPQANSLAAISAVVDAIADGCTTTLAIAEAISMVGRQGSYYPAAAQALGLVVEVHGQAPLDWRLTEAGAAFVALDAAARVDYLCEILSTLDWLDDYTREGEAPLRESWADVAGLGEETIDRRVATIAAWTRFYAETPREEQVAQIATAMTGCRANAPAVAQAHRAAARRRHSEPVTRICPRCHIIAAPAASECESCGNDLT